VRVTPLRTEKHFTEYAAGFSEAVRSRSKGKMSSTVSLDYLQRCVVVRGVIGGGGEMMGGYAIGANPPLRLLEFVPEQARESLRPPRGATWGDCCEIACMWRTPRLSHVQMDLRVWPWVAWDSITAGRRHILGHNENKRLDKHYTHSGRQTLYTGPSSNGLDSHLLAYSRMRMLSYLLGWSVLAPWRLARWRLAHR
jgi:hypothetical protein